MYRVFPLLSDLFVESYCLRVQCKLGGEFLLKLNICWRPIENKYCEGKLKRTLERELKVPETASVEGFWRPVKSYSNTNKTLIGGIPGSIWSLMLPIFVS